MSPERGGGFEKETESENVRKAREEAEAETRTESAAEERGFKIGDEVRVGDRKGYKILRFRLDKKGELRATVGRGEEVALEYSIDSLSKESEHRARAEKAEAEAEAEAAEKGLKVDNKVGIIIKGDIVKGYTIYKFRKVKDKVLASVAKSPEERLFEVNIDDLLKE